MYVLTGNVAGLLHVCVDRNVAGLLHVCVDRNVAGLDCMYVLTET